MAPARANLLWQGLQSSCSLSDGVGRPCSNGPVRTPWGTGPAPDSIGLDWAETRSPPIGEPIGTIFINPQSDETDGGARRRAPFREGRKGGAWLSISTNLQEFHFGRVRSPLCSPGEPRTPRNNGPGNCFLIPGNAARSGGSCDRPVVLFRDKSRLAEFRGSSLN